MHSKRQVIISIKNFILYIFLTTSSILFAQQVSIPDINFKNALVNDLVVDTDNDSIGDQNVDINNDGEIQISEAEAVLNLIISNQEISSLEGIQSFINLQYLDCSDNLLTELSLSQNTELGELWVQRNELNTLDVSQNTQLFRLFCSFNNLTEIDLSNNIALSTFSCRFNDLISIDVSNNINLTTLSLSVNQITSIDVSLNSKLVFFSCGSNLIDEIDLSQNPNLSWIQCGNNPNLNFLDIRNGENTDLSIMWANETPNLRCILVDDVSYSNNQECGFPTFGWCIDQNDSYGENADACALATDKFNSVDVSIVPNPVEEFIRILTDDKIMLISVFDIQGQLLFEGKESFVNVSGLSSGYYILKIKTNSNQIFKRFIKS